MPASHVDPYLPAAASPPAPCRVQLWRAPLDPPPARLAELTGLLTAEERASAASCHGAHQRRRYIAARAALRAVLAARLGCPPSAVAFEYGPHGKPALAGGAPPAIGFNLSHSGELAVIALTEGAAVGVDVEHRQRRVDHVRLAARVCSPAERAHYAGLPEAQRADFFLTLWTRKEAFVKATGEGIWRRLSELDLAAAAPGAIPAHPPWHLYDLALEPDYVGALVVAGPLGEIEYRQLDVVPARG
jgi:4'-phosphopantetheinyl transferase